ncbi:hypothetical protein GCM10023216_21900 [Isoptericola chiayiensis]|uniref:Uncharacterized protein n=1 Tax=Isoptericola chiayiensis TaxID=579446 RepID=A0ABP8YIH3_9MICO
MRTPVGIFNPQAIAAKLADHRAQTTASLDPTGWDLSAGPLRAMALGADRSPSGAPG